MSDKEHTLKYFCSICGTPAEPIDTNGETCYCDNRDCPIHGVRLESDFFRVRELIENEKRLVRENKRMREAIEDFIAKVEFGAARSVNSYRKFKEALESVTDCHQLRDESPLDKQGEGEKS